MKKIVGLAFILVLFAFSHVMAVPIFCVFNKATLLMISCETWDRSRFDPATQVEIRTDRNVDRRTERWDGATGVRPATQAEINSYDAADPQVIRERAREKLKKRRGSPDPFTRSEDFDALLDYLGIR